MLQPSRQKFRKMQKGRNKGIATTGNKVSFGELGLQAKTSAWVTARQIEATRIAITREMGREGQIWIRIFPHLAKTSKPIGVRMGKGKGSPEKWVAVVKEGTVMFEVGDIDLAVAREALRKGGNKLPLTWKIITPEEKEETKGGK